MARRRGSADRKSQAITVRLSPRRRFVLELLTRDQLRSTSAVIEWLVDQSLKQLPEIREAFDELWSPDEIDRLRNFAQSHPKLMTYEEELTWKSIEKNSFFWHEENGEKLLLCGRVNDYLSDIQKAAENGEILQLSPKGIPIEDDL